MTTNDLLGDHRSRIEMDRIETAERRRLRLAEQRSVENSPSKRVHVWEQLHALSMPLDSNHPLIEVIARDTRLTREQIRDEQLLRSARCASKADPSAVSSAANPYGVKPTKAR